MTNLILTIALLEVVFVIKQSFNCEQTSLQKVKIIEEPINFEFQAAVAHQSNRLGQQRHEIANELKSAYRAANFSGPKQLEQLNGKCFSYLNNNYKWIVCPFQNVTQHEQNMRWNPYKGVLGVWYEWEISDDQKFKSMLMMNGDECGAHGRRSTKINLLCSLSNQTEIVRTSEPAICKYEIDFRTPYACEHSNVTSSQDDDDDFVYTLKVYPHLSEELKRKYNLVYSDYLNGLITAKMYLLGLNEVYVEAGFKQAADSLEKLRIKPSSETQDDANKYKNLTRDDLEGKLSTCEKENKQLKDSLSRFAYSFS